MVRYRLLACFCCSSPSNSQRASPPVTEGVQKETTTVSEPNFRPGDEFAHIDKLRSEVKTMIGSQQQAGPPQREIEDVVVGVDYLPVYREQSGKLMFNGVKLKITFTEPRVKEPSVAS